jgi:signal transduction histidine kinase
MTDAPTSASTSERTEVDRVARLLMDEWERVEGAAPTTSYVATFADMARVIVRDRGAQDATHAEQMKGLRQSRDHFRHLGEKRADRAEAADAEVERLLGMLNTLGICPKDGESMPCMTCGAGL